ncbi:hypothetical protein OROMI_025301 [Orobanche minor]
METKIKVYRGQKDIVNQENNRRVFRGSCVVPCLVKEVPQDFWKSQEYLRGGFGNAEITIRQRLQRQLGFKHENVLKIIAYENYDEVNPPVMRIAMESVNFNLIEFVECYKAELTDDFCHPSDLAIKIVRGIIDGVHYLHVQGIRCAHVRPSNILVTAEGVVKVDPSADTSHLDTLWTAPEENHESAAINDGIARTWWKQSDMYRIASIIFYVVTGGKRHVLVAKDAYINLIKRRNYHADLQYLLGTVSRECAALVGPLLAQNHTSRPNIMNLREPFFWKCVDAARFIALTSNLAEDNYSDFGTKKVSLKEVIDKYITPPWGPQGTWKRAINRNVLGDMNKHTMELIKRRYNKKEITKEERDAELTTLSSMPSTVSSFLLFFRNVYGHEDRLAEGTIVELWDYYGAPDFIWRHMLHCYDGLVTDLRHAMIVAGLQSHPLLGDYLN